MNFWESKTKFKTWISYLSIWWLHGCISAGPHYNPFGKTHGGLNDTERHLGDFWNVESDANCKATFNSEINSVHLFGKYTVIGRTCVLHTYEDDLGKSGFSDSKTTEHPVGFKS